MGDPKRGWARLKPVSDAPPFPHPIQGLEVANQPNHRSLLNSRIAERTTHRVN
jgi:hypothetical protein